MAKNADLILFGGKVHTLDAVGTTATAIAVRKGQILAVGSGDRIEKLAGPRARRIDLAGAIVHPSRTPHGSLGPAHHCQAHST